MITNCLIFICFIVLILLCMYVKNTAQGGGPGTEKLFADIERGIKPNVLKYRGRQLRNIDDGDKKRIADLISKILENQTKPIGTLPWYREALEEMLNPTPRPMTMDSDIQEWLDNGLVDMETYQTAMEAARGNIHEAKNILRQWIQSDEPMRRSEPDTFTLMTWNICWECTKAFGSSKRKCGEYTRSQCERNIIDYIKNRDRDIVCLQEVSGYNIRRSPNHTFELFGRKYELDYNLQDYSAADAEEPSLVITMWDPSKFTKVRDLSPPSPGDFSRGRPYLFTLLRHNSTGKIICVVNVHCEHPSNSQEACIFNNRKFAGKLYAIPVEVGSIIIAGDFNYKFYDPRFFNVGGIQFDIGSDEARRTCCDHLVNGQLGSGGTDRVSDFISYNSKSGDISFVKSPWYGYKNSNGRLLSDHNPVEARFNIR